MVSLNLLAAGFLVSPASAQDNCHATSGQFANMRYCVTSVRAPQGNETFGPEHLTATGDGVWCAATDGQQVITLNLKPRVPLRTIYVTNGYAKSAESFRQNGRVKRVQIETDRGYKALLFPQDSRTAQKFMIEAGRYTWIKFTILETTRGTVNPGVCISGLLLDLEEYGRDRS
jgi:hypothetical protein